MMLALKKRTLFFIIGFSLLITACASTVIKPNIETRPNIETGSNSETRPNIETKPNIESKPSNAIKLAPAEANSASEFLKFAESYSDLPAPVQKQALIITNQVLLANPNDLLHRMKLVMIYGLPSSNLQDSQKAQNLLQQILQENMLLNSQQAFAHVLFDYIVAINKLNKNTQHDDKQVMQLQLKLEATQQKLEAAQQKMAASQQKMIELKNIEKSMGEREAATKNEIAPKTKLQQENRMAN